MPRVHTFDRERDGLFVTASGLFTDAEFRDGGALAVNDPLFHSDIRVLVDFTAVTAFQVAMKTLEAFVQGQFFSEKSRRVFVVTSGFGRSFVEFGKILGARERIQIFHSRMDALVWLNQGVSSEKILVDPEATVPGE